MKNRVVILLLLLLLVVPNVLAQRRGRGFYRQEWTVENGDSIPMVHILPIRKYARKPDMRRYQRLIRQVKKCYPLAKQARAEMERMERQLLAVKDKKEQEKLKKQESEKVKLLTCLALRSVMLMLRDAFGDTFPKHLIFYTIGKLSFPIV